MKEKIIFILTIICLLIPYNVNAKSVLFKDVEGELVDGVTYETNFFKENSDDIKAFTLDYGITKSQYANFLDLSEDWLKNFYYMVGKEDIKSLLSNAPSIKVTYSSKREQVPFNVNEKYLYLGFSLDSGEAERYYIFLDSGYVYVEKKL